jgi:hypothetical protein
MSTNLSTKFSPPSTHNLAAAERGQFKNDVPGIAVPIVTYGGPLRWSTLKVVQDRVAYTEKRDRFIERDKFLHTVAQHGEFQYAIGYAARIVNADDVIAKGGPKQHYAAKCHFCGAGHNWVVFYRRAGEDGAYLGYSGVDCFAEVVTNLKIEGAEAIIEAARKEESRQKKFAKIMAKINDFKASFPGLYEHRETLGNFRNPYRRLWHEVIAQIVGPSSTGITEEWLASCEAGKFDRSYRPYRWGSAVVNDRSARRIPSFLRYLSVAVREVGVNDLMEKLVEKSYEEEAGSPFRRIRPGSSPEVNAQVNAALAQPVAPAPVVPAAQPVVKPGRIPVPADVLAQARALRDSGKYDWSFVVNEAALEGTVAKDSHLDMIKNWHAKQFPTFAGV